MVVNKNPGDTVRVSFNLKNTGSPVSGVGFSISVIFLRFDGTDSFERNIKSGAMSADESKPFSVDITVPDDIIPGTYNLEIEVLYDTELIASVIDGQIEVRPERVTITIYTLKPDDTPVSGVSVNINGTDYITGPDGSASKKVESQDEVRIIVTTTGDLYIHIGMDIKQEADFNVPAFSDTTVWLKVGTLDELMPLPSDEDNLTGQKPSTKFGLLNPPILIGDPIPAADELNIISTRTIDISLLPQGYETVGLTTRFEPANISSDLSIGYQLFRDDNTAVTGEVVCGPIGAGNWIWAMFGAIFATYPYEIYESGIYYIQIRAIDGGITGGTYKLFFRAINSPIGFRLEPIQRILSRVTAVAKQ